jgi:hypothetical protein
MNSQYENVRAALIAYAGAALACIATSHINVMNSGTDKTVYVKVWCKSKSGLQRHSAVLLYVFNNPQRKHLTHVQHVHTSRFVILQATE